MPSQRAIEELQTAALRIRAGVCALRLWERYLTPEDHERLGGDVQKAWRKYGTAGMWAKLRGVTPQRAVMEVAKLIGLLRDEDYQWLLREIGEVVEVEEAMSAAIADGGFVLVERPREAYWKGERIDIDWNRHSALWEFLWELARSSKSGQSIDALTFGESAGRDVVTKRKSRLSSMEKFPIDLIDLIEKRGRGSQQLVLPRERIRVFEVTGVESLGEWLP
jgi:hypothetical protein